MSKRLERQIAWLAFLLALLIGLLSWSRGQDKPQPKDEAKLTDQHRLELLNSFKSAVIAQDNAQRAQARAQQLVQAFYDKQKEVAKSDHYPDGTTFTVNYDTDVVEPVLPKPEDKKDEKKADAKDKK